MKVIYFSKICHYTNFQDSTMSSVYLVSVVLNLTS